jgi:ABC-type spermidine/putrescine transport system permease subunit II
VFLRCLLESAVPAAFELRAYAFETFAMLSAFYDDAGAVAFATPLAAAGVAAGAGAVLTFHALGSRGLSLVRSPELLPGGGTRRVLVMLAVLAAAPFWVLGSWGLTRPVRLAGALARNWPNVQDELARTAVDSSAAAILALAGGFCLAAAASHGWRATRTGLKALFTVPLLIPPVLLGVAMVGFWNQPDWRGAVASTPVLLVIAKSLLILPIVAWPMAAVLAGIDRSLLESVSLAGGRWRHFLRYLFLPAVLPHLPILGLAGFLLAAAEYEVSTLLSPPGWTPFSVRLFSLLHYGVDDVVAGLALVGFCLAVVAALAATWLMREEFLGNGGVTGSRNSGQSGPFG